VIYLDSSAMLKLLYEERESEHFAQWISERAGTPLVSSELSTVEVVRACRRVNAEALPSARALLASVDLIPLTGEVVESAADIGGPLLRSLDAIHLASALVVHPLLSAFVVYDVRLYEAGRDLGLEPSKPGA